MPWQISRKRKEKKKRGGKGKEKKKDQTCVSLHCRFFLAQSIKLSIIRSILNQPNVEICFVLAGGT